MITALIISIGLNIAQAFVLYLLIKALWFTPAAKQEKAIKKQLETEIKRAKDAKKKSDTSRAGIMGILRRR